MGALYLASKLEECPLRIRDLINIYDLVLQRNTHALTPLAARKNTEHFKYAPMSYFGNTFYDLKDAIVVAEMQILKRLGFNVHVVLPYGTLINYLRVLGLMNHKDASAKAWGYLNDACVIWLAFLDPYASTHLDCKRQRMHCMLYPLLSVPRSSLLSVIWISRFHLRHLIVGGIYLMHRGMMCGASVDRLCGSIGIGRRRNAAE